MRYFSRGRLTRESRMRRFVLAVVAVGIVTANVFFVVSILGKLTIERSNSADRPINRPDNTNPRFVLKLPQTRQEMTYEEMFRDIGARYQLDWRILEALAYRESEMNSRAFGTANDMGLMQIIPSTWNEWAPRVGVHDPFDPYSNVLVAAAYLAFVRDICAAWGRQDPRCMLVGYNWGPGQLAYFFAGGGTWEQLPKAQRNYALSVLSLAKARAPSVSRPNQVQARISAE